MSNPNSNFLEQNRVQGGKLPHEVREVLRVAYNRRTLVGKSSDWVRRHDSQYQIRQGDPQIYTMDKDGLRFLRLVPSAGGQAAYNTINGTRGTMRQTDESGITPVGTRGILRYRTGNFPAGGPYGTPVQHHPDVFNVRVDHYRLGRDLNRYPFEIPPFFMKFLYYYAMSMALRREGPGQDIKMSDHYMERFQMGVDRLLSYRKDMQRMRMIQMGVGPEGRVGWGIGEPTLPAYYPIYRW